MSHKDNRSKQGIVLAIPYLIPSTALFIIFIFYPLLKTIYISFFLTDITGNAVKFAGFSNYARLVRSEVFVNSLLVSLKFIVLTVPATLVVSLAIALLAYTKTGSGKAYRLFMGITIAVSTAEASTIWVLLYQKSTGVYNYFLSFLGLPQLDWLTSTGLALPSIAVMTIWLFTGFHSTVLLSGLQNIPGELYEGADIDGSGYFHKVVHITLPMLSPTMFYCLIISTISAFQAFTQFNIMTQGGPSDSTNSIVHSLYREAFINFRFGQASAMAVVLLAIIFTVTLVQITGTEKRVFYQ